MYWLFFLLILSIFKITETSVNNKCPERCMCFDGFVNCRRRSLHVVPRYLPLNTTILDLRNNYIIKIFKSDFKNLHKLQVLLISWNQIRRIEKNVFDENYELKKLLLAGNRLQSIPKISSRHLLKFHYLDLSSNHIAHISHQLLWNLPYLHVFNLADNAIQTLPKHVFDYSKTLQSLILTDNPINCDCRWLWLLSFVNKRCETSPVCENPIRLRQKHLLALQENEIKCFGVKILDDPRSVRCDADEYAHVTFIYKGEEVNDRDAQKGFKIKKNGIIHINSDVILSELQCSIEYNLTLNNIRHPRAVLKAPELKFTLKPKNRLYREGTIARLDCEVIGKPRPLISWYFRGKKLKRSRKYEMNLEKTTLNIVSVLERDVGNYTCIAENKHGRIEASAEVRLVSSSPPVIIEGPESQTVSRGSIVNFRCRAEGEPYPSITWLLNGGEIPVIKGHFHVSDDQTQLTVSKVTKRDEGVYACMAGNTVGSMTAEARLMINSNQLQQSSEDDRFLNEIFHQASENVDRQIILVIRNFRVNASLSIDAIEETRERISKITSPHELMRWFQFSFPQTIEHSRAREIYEESIRLIQKHVEKGLNLSLQERSPSISFESVLSKGHVDMLMQLSGCSGTQNRDPCDDQCFHSRYRTYDGQCNNEQHPLWGASQTHFRRLLPPIYENGFNTPVGWNPDKLYFGYRKPNARNVSRELLRTAYITPHKTYSAMLMQWGQFIDHDLDFIATAVSRHAFATGAICNRTCENLNPCFNIPLLEDDPKMLVNPKYPCIEFERSSAVCGSGETSLIYRQVTYREQMNTITSFIDASGIYGSTEKDAFDLRELNPDRGLLRYDIVSAANKPYLPFERDSAIDCRRNWTLNHPVRCFLAGDFRANEQLGLMSMHTIFLREHNRLASELNKLNPGLDGETIFQEVRKIVIAELQHITFQHWLPKVLGKEQFDRLIGMYTGYQPWLDSTISNAFATAAFRFGHTLVNPILYRLGEDFAPIKQGHISLRDAFFAPEVLLSTGSIDPYLRGLFAAPMKNPTSRELLNDQLTESLFNRAHDVALDLAAINIQRGRDHALPGYVEFRRWCNLSLVENWDDLKNIMTYDVIRKLKDLYGHPGNIDLFAGGIAEERWNKSLIGPTFSCIIAEQFRRIRDADRFWYEKKDVFSKGQLAQIRKVSLAQIICDNSDHIRNLQNDVFLYPGKIGRLYSSCAKIPKMDLGPWRSCCYHLCSVTHNRYRNVQKKR